MAKCELMIRSAISFPVRSEPVPRNYPGYDVASGSYKIITSGRKEKHPSNQAKPDFLKTCSLDSLQK